MLAEGVGASGIFLGTPRNASELESCALPGACRHCVSLLFLTIPVYSISNPEIDSEVGHMPHNRLSARTVTATLKRGRYADGGGLGLQGSKWGTRSWIFRYQRDGRERHMGLGPLHTLSLADARERARKCRQALLDDRD